MCEGMLNSEAGAAARARPGVGTGIYGQRKGYLSVGVFTLDVLARH